MGRGIALDYEEPVLESCIQLAVHTRRAGLTARNRSPRVYSPGANPNIPFPNTFSDEAGTGGRGSQSAILLADLPNTG